MRVVLMIIMLLIFSTSTHANYIRGKHLLEWYYLYKKVENRNPTIDLSDNLFVGSYNGYILGVLDSAENILCTPFGIKNSQINEIVGKYLEEHPEKMEHPGSNLVYEAVNETFPCKDGDKKLFR